jgi:hypothetical protein
MNKSTPLSDLPSMKKQSAPAYEEKENQIVSEILNEIDNSQENRNVNMEVNEPSLEEQMNETKLRHQQQQFEEQKQANLQAQMIAQELSNKKMEDNLNNTISEDNFINNIIDMARQPAIVAVIVALMSLPQIDKMINGFISGREKLLKYATIILLLVKALIGGGIFFGINRTLSANGASGTNLIL